MYKFFRDQYYNCVLLLSIDMMIKNRALFAQLLPLVVDEHSIKLLSRIGDKPHIEGLTINLVGKFRIQRLHFLPRQRDDTCNGRMINVSACELESYLLTSVGRSQRGFVWCKR